MIDSAFEQKVLSAAQPHVGRQVEDVGQRLGVKPSKAYHYPATVVRRLFSSFDPAGLGAFDRRGIEIKTVRKPRRGRPYEAMSFPAFDPNEFVREQWERSTLGKLLRRLLIVPLENETKGAPLGTSTVGVPFFWSPSSQEWSVIAEEWEMFRALIAAGGALRLPGASKTRILHVRTHGRDAKDRQYAPGVGHVTKRGFWLNQDFLQQLIEAER